MSHNDRGPIKQSLEGLSNLILCGVPGSYAEGRRRRDALETGGEAFFVLFFAKAS